MSNLVKQHNLQSVHQYDKRGHVVRVEFEDDTTVVLCLLNKKKLKFEGHSKRMKKLVEYRFSRLKLAGNFEGSIQSGFQVFVEGKKIAKVGFIIAEILSEELVKTVIDEDNALDRALVNMGALDDAGVALFKD